MEKKDIIIPVVKCAGGLLLTIATAIFAMFLALLILFYLCYGIALGI